ncbi:MAG: DUF6542 domain-containing protein [Pseudonocardiaceae bacterium]
MTATQDGARARSGPRWDDVSLLGNRSGIPWWAAVALALGLAATGVFADLQRVNRLSLLFQACYFLGCLLAIVLVERRGLFGPMVQPPLLLAVAVPGVVLLSGGAPAGGGVTAQALAVGTPLINGFPTMAITTGVTVAVGAFRLVTQRRPADGNARVRRGGGRGGNPEPAQRSDQPARRAGDAPSPRPRRD